MKVWVYILIFILGATAFILILSLLSSFAVTCFAHWHAKRVLNKHILKIEKLLPGTNCGACGCKSCKAYAMDVFSCYKETNCCTVGGDELTNQLNECMKEFHEILEPKSSKEED